MQLSKIELCMLCICVCILCFFIYGNLTYPRLYTYTLTNSITIHDKENVLEKVQNGDLIFLSGTTYAENMCKWLGGCIFSHIGLLFRERSIVYIVDCDIGQSFKDGFRVSPLETKLSKYKGDKISCIKQLIGKRPDPNQISKIIDESMEIDFSNNVCRWLFSEYTKYPTKKMFCSEFVSYFLQKLNILKSRDEGGKNPCWYTPGEYFHNKIQHHFKNDCFFGQNIFFRF